MMYGFYNQIDNLGKYTQENSMMNCNSRTIYQHQILSIPALMKSFSKINLFSLIDISIKRVYIGRKKLHPQNIASPLYGFCLPVCHGDERLFTDDEK